VLIVVTVVVLGLVFGLVTVRRRATARWRPDPARRVATADSPWCTNVWVQREQPRRSFRAGDRVTGQLCVDTRARTALFRVPDDQHVELTNVRRVQMWTSRSDFVNTWVEVQCDVNGTRMVVYLNDGGWLGWRPILTSANTRLADALASLMVT
jgi:hypothetical protein